MKLKLRFDSDDMKKFIAVCLVLLYVVCIAISNLSSITSTGEFTGLDPFPAFSKDLFWATILFYLVAVVALLISCKSYFFEFEKGFGISTEKKSGDGYSKWCDAKDMKKQLKLVHPSDQKTDAAGVALINDGKKIYVDDSEYHNLVIGSTGSGKTTAIIFPMIELLAKHGESMILTDPKGELYEKKSNMLRSKGYNIVLLNFREPGKGNAWNPLTLPYKLWKSGNQDKAIELLDDLALNILYDESNKNGDPFWEKTSADYFSGLTLGLFEDAKEEEINLNSISLMTTVGEDKIGGSTYIKEYFNTKDPNGAAYINASSTILAPNDTKMSIIAVFKQKIKLFASRINLSEMLSYSDFDIADIGKKKTAVFIIIQDEKKTYHSLVTILIKQIYETLIDVAQSHGGKLPVRTNFLLDEFANMPPLKDVTTMITAARSRLMRFTMIIQNFAQLNEVYGEQNAETIKGNCGNMIYLISTELKALEEISKMCGDIKVKTGKDDKEKEETRPLITISDLQKLKMNEVIIRRLRMPPFKTKLTPDYKMDWGRTYKLASTSNIKERPRHEVKVFDVREYVKEKKKENNPFAKGLGGTNPFGGSSPFGDFPSSMPGMFGSGGFDFDNDFASPPKGNVDSKIDVDRILKNIDAKIAELEEEEKRIDQEESKNKNQISTTPKDTSNELNLSNTLDNSNLNNNMDNNSNDILKNILNDNSDNNSGNSLNNILNNDLKSDNFSETINLTNNDTNNNVEKNENDNFKSFISTFDDADFVEKEDKNPIEEKDTPENIDELIDKIKKQTELKENIKPNMDLVEENKYKEVSDDEFFDDFFE
ncbi:MAG: type IV secretory system conjugative DNA transfer family protein [Erysipelotrichaceae bacterium]|nr:type IV secretory system conjugative DNA transfer family protein [Erysipelotrichaceae bacterium]